MRCAFLVAPLVAVAACSAHGHERHDTPEESGTRLVVLLVVDQWPEWSFEKKQSAFHGGGFDRLLTEGDWHVGHHPSAATLTAPGHALLGTGEPPSGSGNSSQTSGGTATSAGSCEPPKQPTAR